MTVTWGSPKPIHTKQRHTKLQHIYTQSLWHSPYTKLSSTERTEEKLNAAKQKKRQMQRNIPHSHIVLYQASSQTWFPIPTVEILCYYS